MAKGKAKTSRKGKKAWRRNIPTADFEEFVERSGREERAGGPLDAASNEALFFVDKSGEDRVEKKTQKYRNKVLHCDSVLQRNSLVPPLPAAKKRKIKDKDDAKPLQKKKKKTLPPSSQHADKKSSNTPKEEKPYDLWEDGGKTKQQQKGKHETDELPNVPAVEVDAPGCSYNPTFEDHQEALGAAVAEEMQQIYKKDLQPEPVPLSVPGSALDEEEMFFLEADREDDVNEEQESSEPGSGGRTVKIKKLTRTDLNKRARRRELLKQEAEKQRREKLQEQINRLPEIKEAIQQEDEEREKLWTRRMISKKERLASCPPRLGKHKFKPEPMKVLLTEEVTGSLRKLKGCYSLLKERFKSLQRRGLLEPRVPIKRKASKMWVFYEPGTKGQKERETHAAMEAERKAKKQALAVVPLS